MPLGIVCAGRLATLAALVVVPAASASAPAPASATPSFALDAGTPTGRLGAALLNTHRNGSGDGGGSASIAGVLGADGRLLASARGTFSASGYTVVSEPGRAPRFVPAQAAAQQVAGVYSGAFRINAPNNQVRAIAVVSATEIYVGGTFTDLGGNPGADYVARWSSVSGWQALGGGVSGTVNALAVSGSDVYVGGGFTQAYATAGTGVAGTLRVARWDGTAWQPMGGGTSGNVNAIDVSGTGEVYVGGGFTQAYATAGGGVPGTYQVARWSSTGGWQALGGGVNTGAVSAIAVSGSDVYVGGSFTQAFATANATAGQMGSGGVPGTLRVAKWSSTGGWQALGGGTSGGSVTVTAIAVSGADVYIGGTFTTVFATANATPGSPGTGGVAGTVRVARWDGSAWHALGGGLNSTVSALAVSGSDVYVGGTFTQAYATAGTGVAGTYAVAKWSSTGGWQALGGGINTGNVTAMAASGTGDIYVGGTFTSMMSTAGATAASVGSGPVAGTTRLARWSPGNSSWSAGVSVGNGANGGVSAVAVLSATEFVVAGGFTDLGGNPGADRVARWDGTAWQALGGGVDGTVNAMAVSTAGEVYVGGLFSRAYATADDVSSGVAGTYRVATWSSTGGWQPLGGGMDATVNALAVSAAGDVYVGGTFFYGYATPGAVGSPGSGTTQGTMFVARWDGTAWQAMGGGTSGSVSAIAVSGTDVYVGGAFGQAYTTAVNVGQTNPSGVAGTVYVARWDGSAGTWQAMGGGMQSNVNAIAVSGSDVYVGGQFSQAYATANVTPGNAGTDPVNGTSNVARWDGTAWQPMGGGTDGVVYALAASGSTVHVGGQFGSAYAAPGASTVAGTSRVARWSSASGWEALGSGMTGSVGVLAVGQAPPASAGASFPAGTPAPALFIGGLFSAAGDGTPASNLTYFTDGANLPVELSRFTATASGPSAVRLAWTTESETHSAGFALEHRVASAREEAWREVAFVAGRGTTSERTDYTRTVDGLAPGRHAFRLRQIDLDGTAVAAGTVEVVVGAPGTVSLSVIGNASASPRVRLDALGSMDGSAVEVTVEVFDVTGRRVSVRRVSVAGRGEVPVSEGLASGVYVVRATSARAMQTATLVVR